MTRHLDLRNLVPDVATLVDVGVSKGTPELYAAVPHAYLVMVEPLVENETHMKEALTTRAGEYVLAAAGATDGTAVINVEPAKRGMSSFLERTGETATGDQLEQREVPVMPLDRLLEREDLRPPFGLKIDTEGFELEVIRGAQQFLKHTAFVIAETSVAPRFHGGYSSGELLRELLRSGFAATELLKSSRAYVDVLFEPSQRTPQ